MSKVLGHWFTDAGGYKHWHHKILGTAFESLEDAKSAILTADPPELGILPLAVQDIESGQIRYVGDPSIEVPNVLAEFRLRLAAA